MMQDLILSNSDFKKTQLISNNSTVGEIWACHVNETDENVALKLFILGNPGNNDLEKLNDKRDIYIQELPIFKKLSEYPVFVKIYAVVTENGEENDNFVGLIMENLAHFKTFYALAKEYKSLECYLDKNDMIHLLKQYLDALQYLHNLGISGKTEHPDNIMVNEQFEIKIVDIDEIGLRCFHPEKDIADIEFIFSPLVELCPDQKIKEMFDKFQKKEIISLDGCYRYLKENFSENKYLDSIYPLAQQNDQFKDLLIHLQKMNDRMRNACLQRDQIRKKQALQEFEISISKNGYTDAYELLKNHGIRQCDEKVLEFMRDFPLNNWGELEGNVIQQYFVGNWAKKFLVMQSILIQKTEKKVVLNLSPQVEQCSTSSIFEKMGLPQVSHPSNHILQPIEYKFLGKDTKKISTISNTIPLDSNSHNMN